MPSISKFLFDTDLGKAKTAATAKPIRRNYTAAEVEAEKGKAFAEGHAKGVADTQQDAATRAAAAFQSISAQLGKMIQQVDAQRAETNKAAVAAAVAMTRKLLPALARREAMSEIEALVAECLGRMHDAPKIVVRLNDMHVEAFRQKIEQIATATGFSGRVAIVADPALAAEDARVEWADGGVERSTAQIWKEIETAIQRFIASSTPQ
ncbi:MAG TPA: FliH/SctL family protein [Alphaproteobacteria bacterium]|nr:FliH/SctL family protein [Alphaproteobacteria bacterium]